MEEFQDGDFSFLVLRLQRKTVTRKGSNYDLEEIYVT